MMFLCSDEHPELSICNRRSEWKSVEHLIRGIPMALLLEDKLKNLQRCIELFQTTSGVNIRDWHGPETIGVAVKAVLNSNGHRRALEGTLQSLSAASNAVQAALDAWPSKETA